VIKRLKELNYYAGILENQWSQKDWDRWKKDLKTIDESNGLVNIYLTLSESPTNRTFESFVFKQSVSKVLRSYKNKDVAVKFLKVKRNCSDHCDRYEFYSKHERDLSNAISKEYHQVGSILKPFIYYNFLKLGKTLEDVVSTKPISLDLISGKWTPRDSYSKSDFITLRQALQKSKNIPLIRIAKDVGMDRLEEAIGSRIPRLKKPLGEYPAQLLGAVELSLEEIANLYTEFINKLCLEDEDFINVLTSASKTTLSRRADKLIKSTRIFGKTGTTNNGLDAWFIADDGEFFYVTWIGLETKRQDEELNLYGAGSAFKIFQNYLEYRGKQIPEFYCKSKI
jgi:penicillin-binding protein 1B